MKDEPVILLKLWAVLGNEGFSENTDNENINFIVLLLYMKTTFLNLAKIFHFISVFTFF